MASAVVVRWPHDEDLRRTLSAAGVPRLLLIAKPWDPPLPLDVLEDWVATTADPAEIRHRLANLEARASTSSDASPFVDAADILRFRGNWIALAPSEVPILARLAESFERCVSREELGVGDLDKAGQATFHTHVHRIRRRIEPLGLVIETLRGRGLVLSAKSPAHAVEIHHGARETAGAH